MGKKNKNAKAQAKKAARKAAGERIAKQQAALKAARELGSPLEQLPPPFVAFARNGLNAALEFATAATLAAPDKAAVEQLLEANMAPIYGAEEWEKQARAEKAKQLAEEDTRLLLVRSKAPAATPSPAASPVKDAAQEDAPEDAAAAEPVEAEDAPAKGAAQDILAFMHFRYEIEEDCLMVSTQRSVTTLSSDADRCSQQLYVYELQVAQNEATRRKGLGKHMLLLAEMIARKAGMSGVMLTCQRANASAQAFYTSCKYAVDAISPGKCDPSAEEDEYDYEIFSKVWDPEARSVLDKRAEVAMKANMEGGGGKMKAEFGVKEGHMDTSRNKLLP